MFQYRVGTSWDHRAYWGGNYIGWGTNGTNSRRYIGPLPPAGSWQQLLVDATLVGLDGQYINGHSFTLYNGQAYFDEVTSFRNHVLSTREASVEQEEKPTLSVTYTLPQLGIEEYKTYKEVGPVRVDLENGNYVYTYNDLSIPGRGIPTEITHVYNSRAATDSPYGKDWSIMPLQKLATDTGGNATISEGDGSAHIYMKSGATSFHRPRGVYKTLTKKADSTYELYDIHEHVTWKFDTSGKLVWATDSNDNTSTYSYTDGKLTKITDAAGRETTLTYGSDPGAYDYGRLKSVVDAAGRETTYTYTSLGHLSRITNAEGKATQFTYQVDTGKICLLRAPEGSLMWIYADSTGEISGIDYYSDPQGDWRFEYPDVYDAGLKVKDVAEVTDPRGYLTTYAFDNRANTLTITDPMGATPDPSTEETAFPNDEAVEASATADYDAYFASMIETLTPDEEAASTRTPSIDGSTTVIEYDGDRNVIKETAKNRLVSEYEYDSNGNLLSETDGAGLETAYEYDSANNEIRQISATGDETSRTYDARGNLVGEQDPDGNVATSGYDAHGNKTWEVNPKGNEAGTDPDDFKTVYTYDSYGNVTKTRQPLIHNVDGTTIDSSTTATYDIVGNKASETDPSGYTSTYAHDDVGKLLSVTRPYKVEESGTLANVRTQISYDGNDRVTKREEIDLATGEVKARREYTYDAAGNTTKETVWTETGGQGTVSETTYAYDEAGNKISETNAVGGTTTYQYDAMNRVTKETFPDGSFNAIKYDAEGNAVKVGSPDGTTVNTYGKNGYNLARTDTLGETDKIVRDGDGNARFIADDAGVTKETTLTAGGNVLEVTEPTGAKTAFSYDALGTESQVTFNAQNPSIDTNIGQVSNEIGLVKTEFDQLAAETSRTYDVSMREQSLLQPNGASAESTYTPASELAAREATGTIAGSTDLFLTSDALGNVTSERSVDASSGTLETSVTSTYDSASHLTSRTDGAGVTLSFGYNAASQLTTVTDSVTGASGAISHAYDSASRLTTLSAESTTVTFGYQTGERRDEVAALGGRLMQRVAYDSVGKTISYRSLLDDTTICAYSYGYDNRGNITEITEGTSTASYGYDSLSRLTSVSAPGRSVSYTYDNLGNRLLKVDSSAQTTITYSYNDANELTRELRPSGEQIDYLYDANGNLVSAISDLYGTTSYAYDNNNQLVKVTKPSGSVVEFVYDSEGNRVEKRVDGTSTFYEYDSRGNLVLELNADLSVKVKYFRDEMGQAVAMKQGGSLYFFLYNGHGDVTGVTDSSGTVIVTYSYDESGHLLSASGSIYNPMRYSAAHNAYFEQETGLYRMGARCYVPENGRWLTRDAAESVSSHPDSYAEYVYVNNNPLGNVDPTGYVALSIPGRHQDGRAWCWAAAAQMVIDYKRNPTNLVKQSTIVDYMKKKGYLFPGEGLKFPAALKVALTHWKVGSTYEQSRMSFLRIKDQIKNKKSPIIPTIWWDYWNKLANGSWVSHMQVIKGYYESSDGKKKYVIYNEPLTGRGTYMSVKSFTYGQYTPGMDRSMPGGLWLDSQHSMYNL